MYNRGFDRGSRFGDRSPREMHTVTCSDCGVECEVPFKPSGDRPVYCRDCLPQHRGERGDRTRSDREMHKTTCADCGEECEVPFKPTEGRPVYCRDCLPKHRKPRF
ncbi:MAG: hypothetical protein GKC04_08950 [Methanomicrobiales archaeon]|nr:hypothetical protein [Methanomicrobiales archaeon]